MPIVTSTSGYADYPISALPKDVVLALRARKNYRRLNATLIRLQCFLEITGQHISTSKLSSSPWTAVLQDFVAANFSSRFAKIGAPWTPLSELRNACREIDPDIAFAEFPSSWNRSSWDPRFAERVDAFEAQTLVDERVGLWSGWTVESATAEKHSLRFWQFYNRYGSAATASLTEACRQWFSARRRNAIPVIDDLAEWLSSRTIPVDTTDASMLGSAMREFYQNYFRTRNRAGISLARLTVAWGDFYRLMNEHVFGRIWATPIPALPFARAKKVFGINTNVSATGDGFHVKTALITPVPLHVTDSQAKELLFRDIKHDFDLLLAWARAEIEQARLRVERRRAAAKLGVPNERSLTGINTGMHYRRSRECPEYFEHASATFESFGLAHLESGIARYIYPTPLAEISWELGVPSAELLLAHATVLVATNPAITTGFLETLEMFDKNGDRTGLIQTDAGWHLVGAKRRRGSRLAEQKFVLNAEALRVVEDIIDLTQPLRDWLRERQQSDWRLLFLGAPSIGASPKSWNASSAASLKEPWLAERFEKLLNLDSQEATELSKRFSLKRLRGSAGVLVYLETGSVQRMAKALGHAEWNPKLLDRYLPHPIQQFFCERWIRLFQTGILCEALRDSSFLLEATQFASMDELDAFLENHAIRTLPVGLAEDRPRTAREPESKVVFGIETGILTLLMSISCAVRETTRIPCGRAMRWAKICDRLVPHLESQSEQPEFRSMVTEARRQADPCRVKAFLYG